MGFKKQQRSIDSHTENDQFFKKSAAQVLQDRLQSILVLELHKNEKKEYNEYTLRGLYAEVMRVISRRLNTQSDDGADSYSSNFINKRKNAQPQLFSRSLMRNSTVGTSVNKIDVGTKETTYRERLGGYLHPRDMRRLVTPFSASNAPGLIVRRHVILLNVDPLRAIVLRDRVMIFVPNGADSMLERLERRVFGGIQELENQVFGDLVLKKTDKPPILLPPLSSSNSLATAATTTSSNQSTRKLSTATNRGDSGSNNDSSSSRYTSRNKVDTSLDPDSIEVVTTVNNENDSNISSTEAEFMDEWDDIENRRWIEMAFELVAVDAVLQTVCSMMSDDAQELIYHAKVSMSILSGEVRSSVPVHVTQERLRVAKDAVAEIEARVQGFVNAMHLVLDEDEDMALMNLSRLVTHPERFILPVSENILQEESDEPELILEAYMQHALSTASALKLLTGKIDSTEDLIMMKLDTVRNRLLLINTILGLVSLVVASGSFIGAVFGMNLKNHMEEDKNAFNQVVAGTMGGSIGLLFILSYVFYKAGSIH